MLVFVTADTDPEAIARHWPFYPIPVLKTIIAQKSIKWLLLFTWYQKEMFGYEMFAGVMAQPPGRHSQVQTSSWALQDTKRGVREPYMSGNSSQLKMLPLVLFLCPNLGITIDYFKLVYRTGVIHRYKRTMTRVLSGINWGLKFPFFFWKNKLKDVLLSESLATSLRWPWT